MRSPVAVLILEATLLFCPAVSLSAQNAWEKLNTPDMEITSAKVSHVRHLGVLVFEQRVKGAAGKTLPTPAGQMEGAPVLGYVFPTTLAPEDVGFSPTQGIVALAVTSHPDFDDTPLWDENMDGNYGNDGLVYHTHWVVLVKDAHAPGGLSVKQFKKTDAVVLPSTNPGMPMYMDSPGHSVLTSGNSLRVVVPMERVRNKTDFRFDAVSTYLEVSMDPEKPMLAVHKVFTVLSGDLSLPFSVSSEAGKKPAKP